MGKKAKRRSKRGPKSVTATESVTVKRSVTARNPSLESTGKARTKKGKANRARRLSDERIRKDRERRRKAAEEGARRRKRRARGNPAEQTAAAARRTFERLHWGLPPQDAKPITFHVADVSSGVFAVLGELRLVEYDARKGRSSSGRPDIMTTWVHKFRPGRTFLLVDKDGYLAVGSTSSKDRYRVEKAGIVG